MPLMRRTKARSQWTRVRCRTPSRPALMGAALASQEEWTTAWATLWMILTGALTRALPTPPLATMPRPLRRTSSNPLGAAPRVDSTARERWASALWMPASGRALAKTLATVPSREVALERMTEGRLPLHTRAPRAPLAQERWQTVPSPGVSLGARTPTPWVLKLRVALPTAAALEAAALRPRALAMVAAVALVTATGATQVGALGQDLTLTQEVRRNSAAAALAHPLGMSSARARPQWLLRKSRRILARSIPRPGACRFQALK
mmetsp:Transcript_16381/g.50113  ORF Transcript_16381/g.50113 Transcript_16381/m.50113 type:complete len:263 (-) Transcript_16381:278-1066(-)